MALLWGLAAVAVIALYLGRVRGPREPASAGMFWDQVLAEAWLRRRWQRWRNIGLRGRATAHLGAGGRGPGRAADGRGPNTSCWWSTTRHAPRGWRRPKTRRSHGSPACTTMTMAILSTGRTPTVCSVWTGHQTKLREALDSITAVDAASEMPATLALARWMTADRPGAKIVVLGDGSELLRVLAAQSVTSGPSPTRGEGSTKAGRPGRRCGCFSPGRRWRSCALEWCLYQRRWIS